jgi:hypothetical protein
MAREIMKISVVIQVSEAEVVIPRAVGTGVCVTIAILLAIFIPLVVLLGLNAASQCVTTGVAQIEHERVVLADTHFLRFFNLQLALKSCDLYPLRIDSDAKAPWAPQAQLLRGHDDAKIVVALLGEIQIDSSFAYGDGAGSVTIGAQS